MSVAELVPVIAGDMDVLAGHARSLDVVGSSVADIGARVDATWQALGTVYDAPESAQLLAATGPVRVVSASVGEDVQTAAAALTGYATEVRDIQDRLDVLRAEAVALDTALAGGADLTDQRTALVARIATAETDFTDAQYRCAAGITALSSPAAEPPPPPGLADAAGAVTGAALDLLGRLGGAALDNPLDVLALAGGAALTVVSAGGLLGSVALDATGVGTVGGIPLGGASLAGVAAGLAIAGAATSDVVQHALHEGLSAPIDTGAPTAATPAEPGRIDESARPFLPDERGLAEKLAAEGKDVRSLPETNDKRTPDAEVDGIPTEFKSLQPTTPATDRTIKNTLNDSKAGGGQATTIIIDAENSSLTRADAVRGLRRFLGTGSRYYDSITIRTNEGPVSYP